MYTSVNCKGGQRHGTFITSEILPFTIKQIATNWYEKVFASFLLFVPEDFLLVVPGLRLFLCPTHLIHILKPSIIGGGGNLTTVFRWI